MIGGRCRSLKYRTKLRRIRTRFNQAFGRNIVARCDQGLCETRLRWQSETLPHAMRAFSVNAKVVLHSDDPKRRFYGL